MSERERPERSQPTRMLTHDERYAYRGYWSAGAVCRIRIFTAHDQAPIVLATELPENAGTSITNMAEYLAAEMLQQHFPQRFEEEEPLIWIEHYPRSPEERARGLPEYARVHFASFTPRRVWLGGSERIRIGQPSWQHLDPGTLADLVGHLPADER